MTKESYVPAWNKLPDRKQIEEFWDEYEMPHHIRCHSIVVSKVALLLGQWLQIKGVQLNMAALETGALLHDIAKIISLQEPAKVHHLEGEKILFSKGFADLAYLVHYHVGLPDNFKLDEVSLVFYADKRVMGDEVVNLFDRFSYILDRYGKNNPERMSRLLKGRDQAYIVEDLIFNTLPEYTPDDIAKYLEDKLS